MYSIFIKNNKIKIIFFLGFNVEDCIIYIIFFFDKGDYIYLLVLRV